MFLKCLPSFCLQKHSKYRHKLFTASHTLRGLCIGQDRYKRRYHILPHAGGVYVEGLESGDFDEEGQDVKEKVKEEKDKKRKRTSSGHSISDSNSTPTSDQKPKLTLDVPSAESQSNSAVLTSPKQVNTLQSPGVVSPISKMPNNLLASEVHSSLNSEGMLLSPKEEIVSPRSRVMSPSGEILSPKGEQLGTLLRSPSEVKELPPLNWFHLFPKKACDETSLTRSSIIQPAVHKGRTIVPPNVRLLSQDRNFCESISDSHHMYIHGSLPGLHGQHHHHHSSSGYHHGHPLHHGDNSYHDPFTPNGTSHQIFHYPTMHQNVKGSDPAFHYEDTAKTGALGLAPPGVDIQKLIKQDPQEAAVLLEIQSLEPAPVPDGKFFY